MFAKVSFVVALNPTYYFYSEFSKEITDLKYLPLSLNLTYSLICVAVFFSLLVVIETLDSVCKQYGIFSYKGSN